MGRLRQPAHDATPVRVGRAGLVEAFQLGAVLVGQAQLLATNAAVERGGDVPGAVSCVPGGLQSAGEAEKELHGLLRFGIESRVPGATAAGKLVGDRGTGTEGARA